MRFSPPETTKPAIIEPIQGTQSPYLIAFWRGEAGLGLMLAQTSCKAPAGQTQPQNARPKKKPDKNNPANSSRLPEATPSKLPFTIR